MNLYTYVGNNPLTRVDPSGHFWETLLDVISIAWSAYDLWDDPSWANAGFLVWDVGATLIPFVPGSYAAKGLHYTDDILSEIKSISNASDFSTGARSLSVDDYFRLEEIASGMYSTIRSYTDDVATIAKNTGWKDFQVQRIKDHLFFNEHTMRDGSVRRFDPDIEIAEAWERLRQGRYNNNDIRLLEHELFESKFEGIFKTDYGTAHDKTLQSGRDIDF